MNCHELPVVSMLGNCCARSNKPADGNLMTVKSVRIQPPGIQLPCKVRNSSTLSNSNETTINDQICIFMKIMKNLKNPTAAINSHNPISFVSDVQICAVHLPEGFLLGIVVSAEAPRFLELNMPSTKGIPETRRNNNKKTCRIIEYPEFKGTHKYHWSPNLNKFTT